MNWSKSTPLYNNPLAIFSIKPSMSCRIFNNYCRPLKLLLTKLVHLNRNFCTVQLFTSPIDSWVESNSPELQNWKPLNRSCFKLTLEKVQWRLHLTQVECPELQPSVTKFFTVSKKVLLFHFGARTCLRGTAFLIWSPLVRRHLFWPSFLTTFYVLYFSHHYTHITHYKSCWTFCVGSYSCTALWTLIKFLFIQN